MILKLTSLKGFLFVILFASSFNCFATSDSTTTIKFGKEWVLPIKNVGYEQIDNYMLVYGKSSDKKKKNVFLVYKVGQSGILNTFSYSFKKKIRRSGYSLKMHNEDKYVFYFGVPHYQEIFILEIDKNLKLIGQSSYSEEQQKLITSEADHDRADNQYLYNSRIKNVHVYNRSRHRGGFYNYSQNNAIKINEHNIGVAFDFKSKGDDDDDRSYSLQCSIETYNENSLVIDNKWTLSFVEKELDLTLVKHMPNTNFVYVLLSEKVTEEKLSKVSLYKVNYKTGEQIFRKVLDEIPGSLITRGRLDVFDDKVIISGCYGVTIKKTLGKYPKSIGLFALEIDTVQGDVINSLAAEYKHLFTDDIVLEDNERYEFNIFDVNYINDQFVYLIDIEIREISSSTQVKRNAGGNQDNTISSEYWVPQGYKSLVYNSKFELLNSSFISALKIEKRFSGIPYIKDSFCDNDVCFFHIGAYGKENGNETYLKKAGNKLFFVQPATKKLSTVVVNDLESVFLMGATRESFVIEMAKWSIYE